MREKYLLQDRIEILGPVRPSQVRDVRVYIPFLLFTTLLYVIAFAVLMRS
jgi:phosphatidylinositol N-acetylglucosaminyltransferase subunit A